MAAAANPHGFTRDVEIENAAVNLGMSPDEVKRMRIMDVRTTVQRFVDAQDRAAKPEGGKGALPTVDEDEEHEEVVLPTPRQRSVDPPVPTPSEINQDVMTPSEVQVLHTETGGFMQRPFSSIRQMAAQVEAESAAEPEMKGIEYLTTPVDVDGLVVKNSEGLMKLADHVHTVLDAANNFEAAIREKGQIIAIHRGVLDAQDVGDIEQSIELDRRRLIIVYKWLTGIQHDLDRLIRKRVEVETMLMRIPNGNCAALCDKMHQKIVQMRAVYNVIAVRGDCLQIPARPATLEGSPKDQ